LSVSDPVHGICRCVDRSGLPAIRSCRYAQFWKILFPELVHAQLAAVGAVVLQCPQLGALDLSGDGFGQLGELDAPDSLVGRQVGARMRQDRQRPMRRSDCAPGGSTTNALGTATRRASGLGTREHRLAHAAEHYAQAGRVADLAGGFGLSETAGSAQLRLAPRRCAPAAAPRRSGLPGDAPARRSRRPVAPRLAARVESAGVEAINQELHKRPTSTAVRYCLQWQPLGEDEGAPVGLEAARTRLANSSAERERGDADPGRHTGDGGRQPGRSTRVRSTTAAGTASVSHACRNVRQDLADLHPLGDESNDAHVAATQGSYQREHFFPVHVDHHSWMIMPMVVGPKTCPFRLIQGRKLTKRTQ